MSRERRLGRGLEALLGRPIESSATQPSDESSTPNPHGQESQPCDSDAGLPQLDLQLIDANPYQPRQQFDKTEIAGLCDSIREHGILQPIVVRRQGDRYQLVAGERRLRAAQLAGWQQVPVQIRDVDDRQLAELAIVENVQRKDLNALEKAASFQRYLQEYQSTQEELAARIHVDRSTIANLIRLLELPEEVKLLLGDGEISQGHARALLPLGDQHDQIQFAKKIRSDSLSVRATEEAVRDHIRRADAEPFSVVGSGGESQSAKRAPAPQLTALEEQLRLALGTKIDLRQTAKGRGRITIHFKNNDEFERLRELLIQAQPSLRRAG